MACKNSLCRLNDKLLALLPTLEIEQQQHALSCWPELDLAGKHELLESLYEPHPDEADLATLSRLADYFQCGVYDVVRYTRSGE